MNSLLASRGKNPPASVFQYFELNSIVKQYFSTIGGLILVFRCLYKEYMNFSTFLIFQSLGFQSCILGVYSDSLVTRSIIDKNTASDFYFSLFCFLVFKQER